MMAAPPSPTQPRSNQKYRIIVHEQPKFDLESYIQNYQGRTRLQRLILIGSTSTVLGIDALKAAVKEAKSGRDIKRYLEAVNHIQDIAPNEPEASRNPDWVTIMSKKNVAETSRLEEELKGYKNNLIKESIRMGNEELGQHYHKIGELSKAFEAFSRMRQDAVTSKHITEVSWHLIEVAIEQENWIAVSSNVQKIQGVNQAPDEEKAMQPYLRVADGLAHMEGGEYYKAARLFLDADSGMGSICSTFMSSNDVATYGGLCALASMERSELQTRVLENSNFRTYLELEPHIRRAISFFVNSRYSACLEILESYRPDYLLDIHLQKHLDSLYQQVRTKSIVQYFIPFSCVTLDSLNEAFAAPGVSIDKELSKMIERKELKGRIDTQNKVLTSLPAVPRSRLHADALSAAKEYEREARRRIQHMNIAGADLEVKSRGRGNGAFDHDDAFGNAAFGAMGGGRTLRSHYGS